MADERKLLADALKRYHNHKFTPGAHNHSIFGQAALLLEKSVEVVRRKDCKHYVWDEFDGCYACIHLGRFVKPDFGCIDGERKNDGK